MDLIGGSSPIRRAGRIVCEENKHLIADHKKRLLLSFGPHGPAPVSAHLASLPAERDSVPTSGDITQTNSNVMSQTPISPSLAFLSTTGHVFIRHAGHTFLQKFFDLPNKYEILNTDGTIVLYAGETMENFGAGKQIDKDGRLFDVIMLGLDGNPVLNVASRCQVVALMETGSCSSSHVYSIRDWNMCELFHVNKSRNGPFGDFDILDESKAKIGQFTNNWSATLPNYVGIDKLYGISFPVDMVNEEKVILIGALFTLYFQTLHEGGFRDRRQKQRTCLLCLCCSIGAIIAICLITITCWLLVKK